MRSMSSRACRGTRSPGLSAHPFVRPDMSSSRVIRPRPPALRITSGPAARPECASFYASLRLRPRPGRLRQFVLLVHLGWTMYRFDSGAVGVLEDVWCLPDRTPFQID